MLGQLAHVGGQGVGVAVLAGVGEQGGDLLVDGVGDVDVVVDLGVLDQPELVEVPGLLGEVGEGVGVAGRGVEGAEGGFAGGQVVRVGDLEALPVAFG